VPFSFFGNPNANLTILLMVAGLIGAVVPVIPGPLLIWFGALAWASGERFQRVDALTLAVLGVIALVALFSELWLTPITQRRAGFGWKNVIGAVVGGIAGGILLSGIPVIGTLFGAAVGSLIVVSALTYWDRRNLRDAVEAGRTYLAGCALAAAVEIVLSLLMIAIFAWRVLG
jgi:uncharacterized protein YqgC (DUF456 family)